MVRITIVNVWEGKGKNCMNKLESKLRRIEHMLYKKRTPYVETSIEVNEAFEGETIEQKVFRITNNKEGITDGAPLVYQDRKDGIEPSYDIRTDKMDFALDAMDKVSQAKRASRKDVLDEMKKKGEKKEENDTGGEPIRGTSGAETEGAEN